MIPKEPAPLKLSTAQRSACVGASPGCQLSPFGFCFGAIWSTSSLNSAWFTASTVAPIRDFDHFVGQAAPVFVLADGGSSTTHARMFFWPDSDAYGKVTTNRYRVITLIPFPPETRYRSLGGVYPFERTADEEWRWLAPNAIIELPRLGLNVVHVVLALPNDAPILR